MKEKKDAYYFISKPSFQRVMGSEGDKFIVHFLYCDDVTMTVYLKKKNNLYQVHYPSVGEKHATLCGNLHLNFKRNRLSATEMIPYLFYFKSINHAKNVEKEIKLAFRRWLRSEEQEKINGV